MYVLLYRLLAQKVRIVINCQLAEIRGVLLLRWLALVEISFQHRNCWSQVSLLTKFCHLVEEPFFELPHFFDFWEGVFLSYNDSCTINSQFWFIFSWHRAWVVCHKLEPQPTQFFSSVPFTFYSQYYPMITELLCNHWYYLTLLLDQFSVWTHITYAHNTRRDKKLSELNLFFQTYTTYKYKILFPLK